MYNGIDNLDIMEFAVNYNRHLLKTVQRQIKEGDWILDFGAGIGTYAQPMSKYPIKIICVEIDDLLIDILKKKNLNVVKTLDKIPDGSIDLIYTFNVLEHIEDDNEIINKFYSKLRRGGRVIIYVPAFNILLVVWIRK